VTAGPGAGSSRDPLRVVVLADTHLQGKSLPRGRRARLVENLWSELRGADAILHAGDVLDQTVLDRLGDQAPVHAVLGNNDRTLVGLLPLTLVARVGGVAIGMIHDSGPAKGRARRMRRRFPDCDVVVFGHSHAPVNETGEEGQLLFNPGSAMQRRAQPVHTMGELRIAGGKLISHRIIALDGTAST
jgi:uncharacterized protein